MEQHQDEVFPVLVFDFEDGLPPFADAESVSIHQENVELESRLASLEGSLETEQGRLDLLRHQATNFRSQLASDQQLHQARARDLDTERHLAIVAAAQADAATRACDALRQQQDGMEQDLAKRKQLASLEERLDRVQQQHSMHRDELEAWASARQQKEDDSLSMQKYSRADEQRVRELLLANERRAKQIAACEAELNREVTETRAMQLELEKTGVEYRKLVAERKELVDNYAAGVAAVAARDADGTRLEEQTVSARTSVAERRRTIAAQQHALNLARREAEGAASRLEAAERSLARLHAELHSEQSLLQAAQAQADSRAAQLQAAVREVQEARGASTQLLRATEKAAKRLAQARAAYRQRQAELEAKYQATDDIDSRAAQVAQFLQAEEARLAAAERHAESVKQRLRKEGHELQLMRQLEGSVLSELSAARAAQQAVAARLAKLDDDAQRQQESLYAAEYQVQQLERKLAAAVADQPSRVKQREAWQQKIRQLTEEKEAANATYAELAAQRRRIDEELRAAGQALESGQRERARLETKLNQLGVENDNATKTLQQLQKRRDDAILAENLAQVDITRLRKELYGKADEVSGLEVRKADLRRSREEQSRLLQAKHEALRAQVRAAEDERSAVSKELIERLDKIEKLKIRCQLVAAHWSQDGDADNQLTPVEIAVRRAEEKEALEKEAAEIEREIALEQSDVAGLTVWIRQMNDANARGQLALERHGLTKHDLEQSQRLEEQVQLLEAECRSLEDQRLKVGEDVEMLKVRSVSCREEAQRMQLAVSLLERSQAQAQREAADERAKLDRAQKKAKALSKALRKRYGLPDSAETLIDRDLQLQRLRQAVQRLLQALSDLITQQQASSPDLAEAISVSVASAGDLTLPSGPAAAGEGRVSALTRLSTPRTPAVNRAGGFEDGGSDALFSMLRGSTRASSRGSLASSTTSLFGAASSPSVFSVPFDALPVASAAAGVSTSGSAWPRRPLTSPRTAGVHTPTLARSANLASKPFTGRPLTSSVEKLPQLSAQPLSLTIGGLSVQKKNHT